VLSVSVIVCVNRFCANFGRKINAAKRANEIKAYRKQLLPMLPVSKRGRTVVVLVVGAERAVAVLLFNVVCLFLGAWLVVGMCAAALSWQ